MKNYILVQRLFHKSLLVVKSLIYNGKATFPTQQKKKIATKNSCKGLEGQKISCKHILRGEWRGWKQKSSFNHPPSPPPPPLLRSKVTRHIASRRVLSTWEAWKLVIWRPFRTGEGTLYAFAGKRFLHEGRTLRHLPKVFLKVLPNIALI